MATITNLDAAPTPTVYTDGGVVHSRSLASFLRPANTDSYATGDVIATASAAAIEFPSCGRRNGGSGAITDALLVIGDSVTAAADFELLVFNAEPTGIADNAAVALLDADMEKFVGTFVFPTQIITGADQVVYQSSVDSVKPYVCASASKSLYGILVNRTSAWLTPESAAPIMVSIGVRVD